MLSVSVPILFAHLPHQCGRQRGTCQDTTSHWLPDTSDEPLQTRRLQLRGEPADSLREHHSDSDFVHFSKRLGGQRLGNACGQVEPGGGRQQQGDGQVQELRRGRPPGRGLRAAIRTGQVTLRSNGPRAQRARRQWSRVGVRGRV